LSSRAFNLYFRTLEKLIKIPFSSFFMAPYSSRVAGIFDSLQKEVLYCYEIANKTKTLGYDPDTFVKIPLARNMAERVEGLIASVAPEVLGKGIPDRIQQLEKQYGSQDWRVALVIAEEVAKEKFCSFDTKKKAIEIGIRVGFAYVTVGVVSSPLEGFIELQFRKRKDDGKEYFALIYGGPIRSAGGTGASVSVLIADYVRKKLGYAAYDATEKEVKRAYTELCDYHERVTNLQYFPSEEEITFLVQHLPIQVDGDPSEKYDVSNHKDLDRRVSNKISNGFCLVTAECLSLKAPKVWKQLAKWGKDMDLEQWDFMDAFVKLQKEVKARGAKVDSPVIKTEKVSPDTTYIKDIVAGRPVFGYPLRNGGFRLRYGRGRTSGFSSDCVHPATMVVVDKFIAVGTQFKTERPGKSTTLNVCDSIDGPIVRLKNGEVLQLKSYDEALHFLKDIDEIIYLGDILINWGDFQNRAHKLLPCGFVEEWWVYYAQKVFNTIGLDKEYLDKLYAFPMKTAVSLEQAEQFSKLGVPLHPQYIFYWNTLKKEQFLQLYTALQHAVIKENKILLADFSVKRFIELIGCPHSVAAQEYFFIFGDSARALLLNLGNFQKNPEGDTVLAMVNSLSLYEIKDKCGYFIGARMGRPEKAKMRKMIGSPHLLFPVGNEGGRLRCFQSALETGKITSQFPMYTCGKCQNETILQMCEKCGSKTQRKWYCRQCNKTILEEICPYHGKAGAGVTRSLDIKHYFYKALEKMGSRQYPDLIKGVRGMSSVEKIPEHLIKGILRAKYTLGVNKDGTVRYDMIELPCTHFKAKEVGTSLEKLKSLGYTHDVYGKELFSDDQILELFAQDVILPSCPESPDEGADEILFRVAGFIDEELEKLYGTSPYYSLKSKRDLVGHLIVAMSPHTSAGIVCRIVGFSKVQGLFAHPLLHSIMRRDCVYPTTELIIKDTKGVQKVFIGTYVDELISRGAITKKIDMVGTLSVENIDNVVVYGVDSETFLLKEKKVKYFIKGPLEKNWVKLTSHNKREFIMTPNHDYLTFSEGAFITKKAKEVTVKDAFISLSSEKNPFLGDKNVYQEFTEQMGDIYVESLLDVSLYSSEAHSYCLDVEVESLIDKNVLWGDNILNLRCDGDEAGCMLLLDTLLNFSQKYLPNTRGITQDAPLVLTGQLIPSEVDDMVFDMDIVDRYPLELYEAAAEYKNPWDVKIKKLGDTLGTEAQYEGMMFTHDTDNFNAGVLCSAYKILPTMKEKVLGQMEVARKLRAVDVDDVAKLVIERHFLRDIKGNLRKFSQQTFRCGKCNEIYRRPPLAGLCKCGGKLMFTISEGSIVKYLDPAMDLTVKYNLPPYLKQTLVLLKDRIESVFGKEVEKQEGLGKWF